MRQMRLLLCSLAICQLTACSPAETKGTEMKPAAAPPPSGQSALAQMAGKKVFFGHQSVGVNILDGIEDLSKAAAIRLNIIETSDAKAFDNPVFAHARVGKNAHPSSKLSDFEGKLSAGIGQRVDIALFKFCYVDITAKTEVGKLFKEYEETMSRIEQRYPKMVIIHVTVPLRTVERGVKARIKQLAGIEQPADYADNIKRNQFNTLLRGRYLGKEPIFDLATLEATAPDGSVETFSVAGRSYQALFPGYSDDGGHLAPLGRKMAAQGLLMTLSALP